MLMEGFFTNFLNKSIGELLNYVNKEYYYRLRVLILKRKMKIKMEENNENR